MRHWEKNKKADRRSEDRDFNQPFQDHKKKKLKPTEKSKYRLKAAVDDDDDDPEE